MEEAFRALAEGEEHLSERVAECEESLRLAILFPISKDWTELCREYLEEAMKVRARYLSFLWKLQRDHSDIIRNHEELVAAGRPPERPVPADDPNQAQPFTAPQNEPRPARPKRKRGRKPVKRAAVVAAIRQRYTAEQLQPDRRPSFDALAAEFNCGRKLVTAVVAERLGENRSEIGTVPN